MNIAFDKPAAKWDEALIKEGKIKEAQELCALALSGIPEEQRHYEPLGNLYLEFDGTKFDTSQYQRELDLERAVVTTSFTLKGVHYQRNVCIISGKPDHSRKNAGADACCQKDD